MTKIQYNDWKNKKNILENGEPLFARTEFFVNGSKKWDFYKSGFIEYITDHQEITNEEEMISFKNNQNKNIESNFTFVDYMIRDDAKTKFNHEDKKKWVWQYSNYYIYKNQEVSTKNKTARSCKWELKKKNKLYDIHPRSHIWSIVISEKDLLSSELMFKNQHLIVDRYLRAVFDFPVKAVASFHDNTSHPHIHIVVYQSDNTKEEHIQKKFKNDLKKLNNGKKAISFFKFNNQNYWDKILNEKRKIKFSLSKEKISHLYMNEFKFLSKELNGKYEFNRLNKKQKELIDKFFDNLNKTKTTDESILKYQKDYHFFNKTCEFYLEKSLDEKYKLNQEYLLEKIQKIQKENDLEIKNKILKMIKDFDIKNKWKKTNNKTNKNDFYKKNNSPAFNKKAKKIFENLFFADDSFTNPQGKASLKEFEKILKEVANKSHQRIYSLN